MNQVRIIIRIRIITIIFIIRSRILISSSSIGVTVKNV